jgi:hypothetical protein
VLPGGPHCCILEWASARREVTPLARTSVTMLRGWTVCTHLHEHCLSCSSGGCCCAAPRAAPARAPFMHSPAVSGRRSLPCSCQHPCSPAPCCEACTWHAHMIASSCCRSVGMPGKCVRQHMLCSWQVRRAAPLPELPPRLGHLHSLPGRDAAGEEEPAPAGLQVWAVWLFFLAEFYEMSPPFST